jgi:hypothetical protein
MQPFNIYESCINKNEINNSVAFSQNTFNDYSLHSRIGRQKLVCEIIMEQETIRGGNFFFEPKISTFGVGIENKTLRTA